MFHNVKNKDIDNEMALRRPEKIQLTGICNRCYYNYFCDERGYYGPLSSTFLFYSVPEVFLRDPFLLLYHEVFIIPYHEICPVYAMP